MKASNFPGIDDGEWIPAVDINETDDHVVVTAELPGIDPEDIDVKVAADLITIKGEKKLEEESEKAYERYVGSFQRSFRLSSEVDGDGAEANFKNGVLKIRLPRIENTRKKTIKINCS